jgi:hypothetical protein
MRYVHHLTMAAAAVAVFVCSWFYRFNDPNGGFAGLTDDHFFYLVRGWQILLGELPVRDFIDHGAPLYFYVSAAVQMLFGRGTLSELAFSVTMIALGAASTFWLAARASGSIVLGLLGAVFQILLLPRFYNYPKILVYTAAIPVLWWLADRAASAEVGSRSDPTGQRWPLVWLAVITVVGFLFRHDHGVFVALATAAMLLLLTDVPWRERTRHALLYGVFVVALAAPYLLFIQLNGGVGAYIEQASAWAEEERARTPIQWPGLLDNPDGVSDEARQGPPFRRAVAVVRDNGIAWFYYLEIALPIFALAVLAISRDGFRPGWPRAVPKIAIVALLGLILDAGFLRSPLQARLADPSVPHAILIAWLAAALPRMLVSRRSWRPALQAWAVPVRLAVAVAAIPFVFVLGSIFSNRLYDRLDDAYLVDGPGQAMARMRTVSQALRDEWDLSTWTARPDRPGLITLALYLNSCTPPDARIFVQPYIPQVLALARRGFAAGHADLRPGFFDTPEAQTLALRRMRRQYVPVVLLDAGESLANFRESFPVLTGYFDAAYEMAGTHTFDDRFGITLLIRSDARQTGVFEPLGWPCLAGSG